MRPSQPCTEFSKNIAYAMVDIVILHELGIARVTIREGFTKNAETFMTFAIRRVSEGEPFMCHFLKNEHLPLFYLSISSLNILLQMLKSLYEKQKLPSLTLTYVHKLGQRFLRKEIEQSRFYKNIARVDNFEANSSSFYLRTFWTVGAWRLTYRLEERDERVCSAF